MEMQEAVYHLTTRKPHEEPDMRLTTSERTAYSSGYYRALAAALRCMEHVLVRRALWLRERRRKARASAAAAAALLEAPRISVGEQARRPVDHVAERGMKRAGQVLGKYHSVISLREFIPTDGDDVAAVRLEHHGPDDASKRGRGRHPATIHPEGTPAQLPDEPGEISKCDGDAALVAGGLRSGELALRQEFVASKLIRQRVTKKTRARGARG